MGNQSGKNIDLGDKKKKIRVTKILKRFEMCPAGHRPSNNNIAKDVVDNPQIPERRIYHINSDSPPTTVLTIKPKSSEWVDVPLDVPESPPRYIQRTMASPNNTETPKVPPRKHIRKKKLPLETTRIPYDDEHINKMPVEEMIIVPKKEKVHICDGTHHHVANHQMREEKQIRKNLVNEEHLLENEPTSKRQKTISVISLPDYNQLNIKPKEYEKFEKNKQKSVKERTVSVASLPNENKVSFSAATAERLENYITKCKSFGSLRPQQVIDKMNDQETNPENDSDDDSWDGLDDWDLAVLEHESEIAPSIPPYVPKSTVRNKTRRENPVIVRNLPLKMPNSIQETDEKTNTPVPKITTAPALKKSNGDRRESIDDFFTNTSEPDTLKREEIEELIKNSRLGRRGSEAVSQGYDTKCYPFKPHEVDASFQSDAFFSTAFIENESRYNNPHFPFKNNANTDDEKTTGSVPQKASRRRSGSVNTNEIISSLQNINRENIEENPNEKRNDDKLLVENSIISPLETNDHSNLLKIINENPLCDPHSSINKM